jgi:hypothetical protein
MGAAQASTNLVSNGTFVGLSDWTVVQATSSSIYAAGNVANFVGIGAGDSIAQTLSGLTVSDTYEFTFELNTGSQLPASFEADFGSTVLLGPITAAGTGQYVSYDIKAVATSATEVLKFSGYNAPGDTELRNVSVTDYTTSAGNLSSVPEPEIFGLMMVGLSVISLVTRRKQNTTSAFSVL